MSVSGIVCCYINLSAALIWVDNDNNSSELNCCSNLGG